MSAVLNFDYEKEACQQVLEHLDQKGPLVLQNLPQLAHGLGSLEMTTQSSVALFGLLAVA